MTDPDPVHPRDCPVAADYYAAWDAWAADLTNQTLWIRMNAALDGLEAQPPHDQEAAR